MGRLEFPGHPQTEKKTLLTSQIDQVQLELTAGKLEAKVGALKYTRMGHVPYMFDSGIPNVLNKNLEK